MADVLPSSLQLERYLAAHLGRAKTWGRESLGPAWMRRPILIGTWVSMIQCSAAVHNGSLLRYLFCSCFAAIALSGTTRYDHLAIELFDAQRVQPQHGT